MRDKQASLQDALSGIGSGATVALGGNLLRRQPNAAVRHLIHRGVRDLTILGWAMTTTLDMLAAAGAVRRYEGVYSGMFAYGLARNVRRGVEQGAIEVRDFSESAMVARFRAAAQGLAFMPVKALLGTDMARYNPEQVRPFSCPFTGGQLHAVQAAKSDFTIIHGYCADVYGNVQWPVVRDTDDIDQLIASAATRLIVTVERIVPAAEVAARPQLTYIPGTWVEAVVEVPYGAHPVACDTYYDEDDEHLKQYLDSSLTEAGARRYIEQYARAPGSHDDYLEEIGGPERLGALTVASARAGEGA